MFPTLNIGPVALQANGLILLVGLWLGLWLSERLLEPNGSVSSENLYNGVGIALIAALIGGRLVYVFQHFEAFRNDLLSILSLNYNLLDAWGAAAVGLLALLIYLQRNNIGLLTYLDALTPFFAVMFVAVPFANLAVGTGYGTPTSLPWAIDLWGAPRHPTQIYQMVFGLGVLIWLIASRRNKRNAVPGMDFFVYLGITSFGMIVLETFRADQSLVLTNLRSGQITAWLLLAVSLLISGYLRFSYSTQPDSQNAQPAKNIGESNEIPDRL